MITEAEKTDIRRFAGYGAHTASTFGAKLLPTYGVLEYLMNNLSLTEEEQLREVYLTRLRLLEVDLVDKTSSTLDTAQAAVWIRNRYEHKDRRALFFDFRRQMCSFLGIQPGPHLGTDSLILIV